MYAKDFIKQMPEFIDIWNDYPPNNDAILYVWDGKERRAVINVGIDTDNCIVISTEERNKHDSTN